MRIALAVLLLCPLAVHAGNKPKAHPHFDDGGTLHWHTQLAAAQAQAKKEGKLVFIEYGRKL